jgi:CRP-like cAMP-binding protein
LTEDEKEALAATMVRRTYRKDAVVVEQGVALKSLMIVRSGVLTMTRLEGDRDVELARLAPGDCFGEAGLLTASGEVGTIRALTFVVVYEIAQAGLAPLLRDRPGIADDLGLTLARRSASEKHPFPDEKKAMDPGSVSRLVERIRHLFDLPHDR